MDIWLTQLSHAVALHSRSISRPTIRTSPRPTPSLTPNSIRPSNQELKRESLHNQRVRQIWHRFCDIYLLARDILCCCLLLVAILAGDTRHRRLLHHRFIAYKSICPFYHSQSSIFFSNTRTGPSGTVKLAKKEPAAKTPSAAKEKKPAAKVRYLNPHSRKKIPI